MADTIRVLLADTQPIWRLGVRSILSAEPDLALAGEAENVWEVRRLSRELDPHILLLEAGLPGPPVEEVVTSLQRECPALRVLIVMGGGENGHLPRLLAAGAAGYISRYESAELLAEALRMVARGKAWHSVRLLAKAPSDAGRTDPELSARELEVLGLVAQGWTNVQAASTLGISERTVRFHLGNLCHKLSLRRRADLIAWAVRHGLG